VAVQTVDKEGQVDAVWTVASDGGAPRRLYAAKGEFFGICWSAVAGELYLQRFRNGATELVRLLDADQQPAPADVVASGMPPAASCDVSSDGQRLLQVRTVSYANLWRIDLGQSASVAAPVAITQGTSLFGFPHLSRDGESIAVTRSLGLEAEVVSIPVTGGEPVSLTEGRNGSWSPDGRRLAFFSDRSGTRRVWTSDPEGNRPVELKDSAVGYAVMWLPDGRLAWNTPDARDFRIRDLATGREDTLVKDPSVGQIVRPTFSPKGDEVAVLWNRKERGLWVLTWPARVERLVARGVYYPVGWAADGQWIYATEPGTNRLVKVSAQTGQIEPLATVRDGSLAGDCALSADARTLVCSIAESKGDAWLVERFDPRVSPLPR
jgi:WD40 repeat protein